MTCQAQSVTNVTAWATLLGSVPWAVVQDPGDEVDPEKNVTNATAQGTLPVTARRRRITATAVMELVTLPKIVNTLLMNPHATTVPRWAT